MQCLHIVKINPLYIGDTVTVEPFIKWLKENNIRFHGGKIIQNKRYDLEALFRFENIEDAVAFKLRWI